MKLNFMSAAYQIWTFCLSRFLFIHPLIFLFNSSFFWQIKSSINCRRFSFLVDAQLYRRPRSQSRRGKEKKGFVFTLSRARCLRPSCCKRSIAHASYPVVGTWLEKDWDSGKHQTSKKEARKKEARVSSLFFTLLQQ